MPEFIILIVELYSMEHGLEVAVDAVTAPILEKLLGSYFHSYQKAMVEGNKQTQLQIAHAAFQDAMKKEQFTKAGQIISATVLNEQLNFG